MSRLSGANFMRQWRAAYSASNPGQRLDRWFAKLLSGTVAAWFHEHGNT